MTIKTVYRNRLLKWTTRVHRDCVALSGGDTEAALLAAECILSTQPMPDEVEIEQDECDDEGNDPIPVDVAGFFAYDIHNRRAQGILNRSLSTARGLSRDARRDLAAALKKIATGETDPILNFIDKYRVKLARVLTTTQLAALLEGAQDVAVKVPPLGEVPVEGLPLKEQERILDLRRSKPPPIDVPRVGGGAPEDVHLVTIEEAVKNLQQREVMDRQTFDQLEAAARAKAFTVANVAATETLTKLRDSLAQNVKEGADYETWRAKVLEGVDQGTFLSDPHQETVFRTNVQTAFSDGQAAVLAHPLIRSGFPYSAYDAIHDDRVRENHLALERLGINGTNVYRNDDPVFALFRPPWDYNDRCGWTPLTVRQAAERGVKEAQVWLDTGVEPAVKAFVPMPDFRPPPGFQRAVASAPLSIQMSLQPVLSFAIKTEEETDTALLYGSGIAEVGSGGEGMLQTAKEGKDGKGIKNKIAKAKTSKGKKLRRALFKRLRVKNRWSPASAPTLSNEPAPPKDQPDRLDLISGILVLLFGDQADDVAKDMIARRGGVALAMINGVWQGPNPPNPTGWVQIAPGPRGGKRWAPIGSRAAATQGVHSTPPQTPPSPSPQQAAAPAQPAQKGKYAASHQQRKAAAVAAYNSVMAIIVHHGPAALTPGDKAALAKHLSVMDRGHLNNLYQGLGGTAAIVGSQRQPWVHAIKGILSGTTPVAPGFQSPVKSFTPSPIPKPAPSPFNRGANVVGGTPHTPVGASLPFSPEINWDIDKPQPGVVINGIPFSKAPDKFWEKTPDVDIGEPPPVKPIARVGVLIKEPDGRIWIVQPTNQFGNRKYTFPGGHVEPGLSNQQNAMKEVWEECGLQVKITGHVGDFEDSNNGNNGRLYIGERVGGQPWDAKIEPNIINQKTGKPAAESHAVTLVTPDRAASLLHRTDDLAQLMAVNPIKLDHPTKGKGSEPLKKFIAATLPAAEKYDKDFKKQAGPYGSVRGNPILHAVQNMRGFNNKPKVVKKADFDKLVSAGTHIEVLRGVNGTNQKSAKAIAEEFRSGQHFPGHGVYGSGTYADSTKGHGNVSSNYGSEKLRIAIPKSAKIVKLSKLEKKVPSRPDLFDHKYARGNGSADQCWWGVQAALAGYDVIEVDKPQGHGKGFYVILNRSIVTVQDKAPPKGYVIK